MKIYCSCCDKVQPVRIDNCRDAKTNEPFQDIVCGECGLVITSGTGIKRQWVGLTQEDIDHIHTGILAVTHEVAIDVFAQAIEEKLKEKNT